MSDLPTEQQMADLRKILVLNEDAGISQAIDAIRQLQSRIAFLSKSSHTWHAAWLSEHNRVTPLTEKAAKVDDLQNRLRRAESLDNWRVVWTGDALTENAENTPLVHGNLVELEAGVGQVFIVFRPCCDNPKCRCTRRVAGNCRCAARNRSKGDIL